MELSTVFAVVWVGNSPIMISILKLANPGKGTVGVVAVALIGVGIVLKRKGGIKTMLLSVTVWGVVMKIVSDGQGTQVIRWVIMILTII